MVNFVFLKKEYLSIWRETVYSINSINDHSFRDEINLDSYTLKEIVFCYCS